MRRLLFSSFALALFGCPGSGDKPADTGSNTSPNTGSTSTVSQPPRAEDDLAQVDEGGQVTVGVASNDLVGSNPLALGSVTVIDPVAAGTLIVNPDGTVGYTHDGGEGPDDSFTYSIEDSTGVASNVATVTISVNPINDLPVAVDDSAAAVQGDAVTIPLLANDSDVDDGLDLGSITIVDPPTYASLVDNGDGTVDYQHNGAGVAADQFTYTVSDLSGAVSNLATVDLTVFTTNTPPLAIDDIAVTTEGGLVNINLVYNDIDVDDGVDAASVVLISTPLSGSAVVQPDGSVDYQHDGTETVSDAFAYQVYDYSGAPSNIASIQVVIGPVNDPPVANDDLIQVDEGMTSNAVVLANDTDPDNALNPLTVFLGTLPANGTAIVNGNGSIDYTHDGGPAVLDSFSYFVSDMSGAQSNEATVSVQINQINDPPLAADDAGVLAEAGSVVIDLAANDSDLDNAIDLASIAIYSAPVNGSVQINGDGTVQYDHDGSETVSDSFAYTIDDVSGGTSNVAMVSLSVTPVNDPPVSANDAFVVSEGGLNNLQNILSNDTDADDGINPATVVIDTPPLNGIAVINVTGTVEYSHDGSNTLVDSYTYHVLDFAGASSNVATVNIAVTGTNDPPVANNDSGLLPEGGAINIDVLANDTDSDNGIDSSTTQIVSAPTQGTAQVLPDGSIDYTHNGSETAGDSFTYVVRDLAGLTSNQATVTIVVNPVNDAPTAVADSLNLNEGALATATVLANDSDPDGPIDAASAALASSPTNGVAVVNPDGTIDYTHNGGETVADSFSYTVDDLVGATSNTAVVTVTINPINDPPVATNDSGGSVDEGSAKNIAVLTNDSDVDDGLDPSSVAVITGPTSGSTSVLGDGSITYTHNGSETLSDSFTYTVDDFAGASSNIATVSFTINPINDPPVAVNDNAAASEAAQAFFNVLANDSDADDGLNLASVTIVTAPTNGVAVPLANGTIDYTHDGSNTVVDSLTYTVADNSGVVSNVATVNITITSVNDPPVVANDSANVDEGAGTTIAVLANDTDADDGINPATVAIQSGVSHGVLVVNPSGTVDYTHDGSEFFTDSFTYTVNDFAGAPSNVATVSITVNPVNDPPVAVNNTGVNLAEGAMVNIPVLNNDYDNDDGLDPSSVAVVTAPTRGSYAILPNGSINYTHNGTENFSDSFTYTVRDLAGALSNVATVNITIAPVNDLPVANNDSGNVNEGAATNLALLGNDTDADDGIDPSGVAIVGNPTNGSLFVNANGTVDYTHNGSETASDSFTYTVDDFTGATSNIATVNITVNPVNDPPVAVNNSGVNANEGALVNILVLNNDYDNDDGINPATAVVVTAPTRGSAVVQPNGSINYTHNGSENFSDSFTYRVQDYAGANSNVATVSITITPVNDPPVAVADAAVVLEGSSGNVINVAANDSDADDGLNLASIQVLTAPSNGSATPGVGTVSYTHNGSETLADSFTYRISDNSGAISNTVAVSITVTPVNDPPVANDDSALVPQYSGTNISVLSNDVDPEGGLDPYSIQIVSYPSDGAAYPLGNGTVDYYHYGFLPGNTSDSFTYVVYDAQGASSNVATVYMTIDIPVTVPDAVDDHARVPTEVWSIINAAGNDSDLGSGLNYGSLTILSGPYNGVAVPNGDGTVDYLHDWTSGAMSDSFQYTIDNNSGTTSAVATVTIDVDNPSACVATFEDAWDAFGQSADPSAFYSAPYGLDFTVTAGGLLGGMVNGDPGNWDVEGTNGTAAWGMWNGVLMVDFGEPVVDVSLDFIRAFSDQNFTVYAYLDGAQVDSRAISVTGAWDFDTAAFAGPLDRLEWTVPSNFLAVDDIRYSAPTLPCPSRVVEHTVPVGPYIDNLDAPYWANKGYTFTALETFSISGGAWWLNLPVGGIVKLNIYNSAGALLASGNSMSGTGLERWYNSELNFTFVAGNSYTASFYTNLAGSAVMDRYDGVLSPGFNVDGLMSITGNAASGSGDGAPEGYPGASGNSWNPIQRLIRTSETVQNLGYQSGSGDFSCPAFWRLPNLGELYLVDDWLNVGDTIDYYQNIAVDDPSGCICKWNDTWCGEPSIETYDGRMCGDYAQLHMCVEDR